MVIIKIYKGLNELGTIVAENLSAPWGMDISNEGNIYFTERSGTVKVIENGNSIPKTLIKLNESFYNQGEGGLMGIALDPSFSQNHYIYVMYSYFEDNNIFNKVIRLIENNNIASIDAIIIDKIPGSRIHNGGRIKIGPDNNLYITTGDAANPLLAQDLSSLSGKILRLELDGSIPNDNPFPNSPIYSLGHRNPQGLTWNSRNVLYSSEHGQTAHDEINIIEPGANYGWPLVEGNDQISTFPTKKPLIHSGEITWAPSGIAFITQGPWQGKLLVANLRGQELLCITFNKNENAIKNVKTLFNNEYGRLRDVFQGNDGSIYIITSNKDGRGQPKEGDDKIIKLTI